MKTAATLAILVFAGLFAWLLATRLSADALGFAVGVVFGVLAGVPAALLVLAAGQRRPVPPDHIADERSYQQRQLPAPPIVIVTQPQPQRVAQPQSQPPRQFRITGETAPWYGDDDNDGPILVRGHRDDW